MKLRQLRLDIQKRHEKGETYQEIADSYGITKPMAFQIAVNGYKPGKKTAALLGLDTESGLAATRKRRMLLDEVARVWEYASWCAYETQVLEEYRNYVPETHVSGTADGSSKPPRLGGVR